MPGYEGTNAQLLLDDYGLCPLPGVFMPSNGEHLLTKYEKYDIAGGNEMYILANSRVDMNVLVKFSP